MKLPGLSDSIANLQVASCALCGAEARIDGDSCVSCLLRAGLDEAAGTNAEDFEAALSEIDIRDNDWRLGNYEVLEEIGRGGMGVIYRARQRHSKRIVALKRVLSYHGDSRDTLERFRREAEAAASLDHPNILPIHEVGEADGLPFFTMKYATGGSLQQAAPALSADPRECIRLLAKVARAVAYAHHAGILHRDLKPGNILLDAHGEPMVTDFGLAKWIDADSDLTRSLAIFGTPGFIAPEQAQGDRAALTAAADVYSLGAILFELLTGRPPFIGEHALAVIHQAAEKTAPKLRSIVRKADRDLETICAKCLERDPRARYGSAAALADDLGRWWDGRPIVARPVAPPVQAWRWARRTPRLAGSIALCLILAALGIAGWTARSRLEAVVRNAEIARHSVIIAPFEDLDALSRSSTLAQSITAALAPRLSSNRGVYLRAFPVTAKPANYFSNRARWKEITHDAPARLVITGSVRNREGKYRLALYLIDIKSGALLQTSIHDGDSIEAMSQEISTQLVARVQAGDSVGENLADTGETNDPGARSYFERGKEFFFRYNMPDLERAIVSVRKALDLDPNYGQAHALFANACQLRAILDPDGNSLAEAEAAAQRAVELAPLLPDAHRARAGVLQRRGLIRASIDSYLTANELEPGSPRTAALLGNSYALIGRPDLAIWWLEGAMRQETRPIYADNLGDVLVTLGEFPAAEKAYRDAAIFRPDLPVGGLGLSRIALVRDDFTTARAECARVRAAFPASPEALTMAAMIEFFSRDFPAAATLYREALASSRNGGLDFYGSIRFSSALGFLLRQSGDAEGGRALLADAREADERNVTTAPLNPQFCYSLAATQAASGETDSAIASLSRAVAAGWIDYHSLGADPRFDSLRESPQFAELQEKMRQDVGAMQARRRASLAMEENKLGEQDK